MPYLFLAREWKIPPWELERLDDEDETASTWIERYFVVEGLRQKYGKN
jgi:hypothetical protein